MDQVIQRQDSHPGFAQSIVAIGAQTLEHQETLRLREHHIHNRVDVSTAVGGSQILIAVGCEIFDQIGNQLALQRWICRTQSIDHPKRETLPVSTCGESEELTFEGCKDLSILIARQHLNLRPAATKFTVKELRESNK